MTMYVVIRHSLGAVVATVARRPPRGLVVSGARSVCRADPHLQGGARAATFWNVRRFLATALLLAACRAPAAGPGAVDGPFAWTVGEWSGLRTEAATGDSAGMRVSVRPVLAGAGRVE